MDRYANFTNQIPEEIMQKVEKRSCSNIAIFKPEVFVTGKLMYSQDYHIIISSTPPPDTYVNNKLQSFHSGKIIVFNPDDSILTTREGAGKQYISMLIKPELIQKIAAEMGYSGHIKFLRLQNPYSSELMQAIRAFDFESERTDCFQMFLDSIAVQIAVLLLREFKTNLKMPPESVSDIDGYVGKAVEYINAFYGANITIDDICSEINVSLYHFIRTFKKKTGVSPHKYLLNVRIQKAEELLKSGEYSVSEAARLCGFVSMPHFSSTFREVTGNSPCSYRKIHSRQ